MAKSATAGGRGRRSAGLLVWRRGQAGPEYLLVHPGGPFWARRDEGVWSVPKGLVGDGEDALAAAIREFQEEVGLEVAGGFTALAPLKQKSGKVVACWLVEADLDLSGFRSNTFELEWPPRSGRSIEVPECDRAAYLGAPEALAKILPGQRGFIEEAGRRIAAAG
jgi:predicted NUDIX family NTP pyrophosphohydrolase